MGNTLEALPPSELRMLLIREVKCFVQSLNMAYYQPLEAERQRLIRLLNELSEMEEWKKTPTVAGREIPRLFS